MRLVKHVKKNNWWYLCGKVSPQEEKNEKAHRGAVVPDMGRSFGWLRLWSRAILAAAREMVPDGVLVVVWHVFGGDRVARLGHGEQNCSTVGSWWNEDATTLVRWWQRHGELVICKWEFWRCLLWQVWGLTIDMWVLLWSWQWLRGNWRHGLQRVWWQWRFEVCLGGGDWDSCFCLDNLV